MAVLSPLLTRCLAQRLGDGEPALTQWLCVEGTNGPQRAFMGMGPRPTTPALVGAVPPSCSYPLCLPCVEP